MYSPQKIVEMFEANMAEYTGAKYAVSCDNCTNAIRMCCEYYEVGKVTIPAHTYLSVPQSIIQAGGSIEFEDREWKGIYQLWPYPIYDAAKRLTSDMYIPGTLMCLSFGIKKPLNIGKGGMILTDDKEIYEFLKKKRWSGRTEGVPMDQDQMEFMGYNSYITPEWAARGMMLLSVYPKYAEDQVEGYPDLRKYDLYHEKALIINSHSSNIECIKLFLFCLEKYVGVDYFNSIYLFIDPIEDDLQDYVKVVNYNPDDNFRDQMIFCLDKVEEDVLLYTNEDYLFYDVPNLELADSLIDELFSSDLSFIKFVHTDMEIYREYKPNLYLIDKNCQNTFSQTLSFWKKNDLIKIHEECPPSEIGVKGEIFGHLEVAAKQVCRNLDIKGVCYYNNEPKRGMVHYDTEVFPHVASAIIKGGAWNNEYTEEINRVREEYGNSK